MARVDDAERELRGRGPSSAVALLKPCPAGCLLTHERQPARRCVDRLDGTARRW